MKYSKSQINAINHNTGPALVLAVPGSGKTTVLLARIKQLLDNGVRPESILSLTFSKTQALDMEVRFREKYNIDNVLFLTIHSFAYKIIRSFYHKNVKLIETNEKYNKYNIVRQIYFQFNKKYINDEQLESFFSVSGYLKNTLMDYDEYKKMYGSVFYNFEKIYFQYERFKKNANLIDFDDMLLIALEILQNNRSALSYLQRRFKYIQIDEGQDTSFIQLKILSLVAKPENNLFIVADDDQSIYGFRGASSKELLSFKDNYPDASLYYMQENYRSTKSITDVANILIDNNKLRYNKSIKSVKENGPIVSFNTVKNTTSQINHILEMVKLDLSRGENVAILYRNNISAIPFINKIEDIDYYLKDGKMAFYSHQIIQDIINIIEFAMDPYDIFLFEKIYYKLNLFIKKDFIREIKMMPERLSVIEKLENCEGVNNFFLEKIYLLEYHINKISSMDFEKSVKYIFYRMEYYEYLKEFSRKGSNSIISINRIIDTIMSISEGVKTILDFQSKISKLIQTQKKHSFKSENLTFSTIHGSKGLEFDNVYIIDLINKEFPSQAGSLSLQDEYLEEERRLFYVGITRAKHKLTLFSPNKLHTLDVDRSIFIDEIIKNV